MSFYFRKKLKRIFLLLFFYLFILAILSISKRVLIKNYIKNHGLNVIDFSLDLCSKKEYNSINCTKTSSKVHRISTTICVHDPIKDYTSRMILLNGIKEKNLIELFLSHLKENKDCLFIDIGAHVGIYTLLAAKSGRHVVAVEPFFDNIIRLQKAAKIENLEKKIILINNAVSNQANVTVKLNQHKNIGEQSLLVETPLENKNYRYSVKTIIFDDILKIVPNQNNGKKYEKAILKIDIEGFEPYAFANCSKIFERFKFVLILMEWYQINKHRQIYLKEIERMLSFLSDHDYVPFKENKKLNINNWRLWPNDIFWIRRKNNF